MNSQCFFFGAGQGSFALISSPSSHLSAAVLPTMSASSSTFERPMISPRSIHGFPKRLSSSPLSNAHTAESFVSPSMDNLIHDSSQPRPLRPRRKGLTWNLRWPANRKGASSSTGLIPPPAETKSLKTPWHHGWRVALFGTCMDPTRPFPSNITDLS